MSPVTGSQQAESESDLDFRRLLEALPAPAYTCDAQGLITAYNRRAVQAWGREPKLNDPEDRYCGSFRMSTVDGERVPHDDCWMARCLREQRAFDGEEIVVEREDGTRLVVLVHAIPMFDGDGALIGAINVVVDITGRKRTEQQLRESEAALLDAARRKDEFLATLAHELRNPLAPIRNALRMLRVARDADDAAASLDALHAMLQRQVSHLVRLVDDLMDVSRITRDRIELRREPVELANVVAAAVESAKPMFERAHHKLTVSVARESMMLDADPVRLTQVLANLLNNAAKFTERSGQIWLDARREGAEVVVSVRDNGMGIPSEILPKVFDVFTQADGACSRKLGGLGIGLAIAKRLVEMHEGRLEARSDGAGRGSEFIVRLPFASAVHETVPLAPSTPIGFSRHRILLVDDNRDGADSLARLLRFYGADVVTVYDGATALETIKTYHPSVLLLDIGMPGMEGLEVARRIRHAGGNDLLIIAITGWGHEKDRRLSSEAGIDHHIVKPVDGEALMTLLGGVV